jgi:hypothetical protein
VGVVFLADLSLKKDLFSKWNEAEVKGEFLGTPGIRTRISVTKLFQIIFFNYLVFVV